MFPPDGAGRRVARGHEIFMVNQMTEDEQRQVLQLLREFDDRKMTADSQRRRQEESRKKRRRKPQRAAGAEPQPLNTEKLFLGKGHEK